jgi:ketosteroid isomerase-like protein
MRSPRDVVLAWVDAFNRRDALAAAGLYHDDAVNAQVAAGRPAVGRQAALEEFLAFFRAFPDIDSSPRTGLGSPYVHEVAAVPSTGGRPCAKD